MQSLDMAKPNKLNLAQSSKTPVQILGATGVVGRRMVKLLQDHPYFEIAILSASEQSEGKKLREIDPDFSSLPIGEKFIQSCQIGDCPLVFSALDATVAKQWEDRCLQLGIWVFSNARIYRMQPGHLLSIPEISFRLIKEKAGATPCVITNPNCCVSGLALALYPLAMLSPFQTMHVFTQQSVSGAGYPGVPSLDILGNVIPYISGEEEKVVKETKRILSGVQPENSWAIFCTCTRVPTLEGHLMTVHLELEKPLSIEQIISAWSDFVFPFDLPSAVKNPLVYLHQVDQPQGRWCIANDRGMRVYVGRLRIEGRQIQFTIFANNLVRGAAGGAILNGEMWQYFRQLL